MIGKYLTLAKEDLKTFKKSLSKDSIKCFVGLHDWTNYLDNIDGNERTITLCWKVCDKCVKSKLVFIF